MEEINDPLRRRALGAVLERILPDDEGAGARRAGVADFAERALGEPRWRPWRALLEQGVDILAASARAAYGRELDELSGAEQDAVLERLAEAPEPQARVLLQRLIALALEGFLSDPRHGGNRDGAGWRAVGLEAPECPPPKSSQRDGGAQE